MRNHFQTECHLPVHLDLHNWSLVRKQQESFLFEDTVFCSKCASMHNRYHQKCASTTVYFTFIFKQPPAERQPFNQRNFKTASLWICLYSRDESWWNINIIKDSCHENGTSNLCYSNLTDLGAEMDCKTETQIEKWNYAIDKDVKI